MSTPRVVIDALVPDVCRLPGGLLLRPLSIAHTVLLQKIDSPFLAVDGDQPPAPAKGSRKGREAAAKAAPSVSSELAALAVVYLLTRTEPELDQLYFGFDRQGFDAAVWQFAKDQPPALLVGLQEKLTTVFERATSTLIGGGVEETPADQKKTT